MSRNVKAAFAWMVAANFMIPGLLVCFSAQQCGAQADMDMGPVYEEEEQRNISAYGSEIADDVVIETDPETGSLIVVTDEETNEYVKKILENLDKPVPQVLIKVLFLEVTLTDDFDLGAQGSFSYGSNGEEDVLEILYGLAGETSGGFYKIIDDDLSITLHALETVGSLEVLSRPSVLAKQNEEAIVTVGQEVPFVRNSRVTSDGQTINTVEYEDIGIILTVTPFITPDGLVDMELNPEISTLTSETVPISDTIDAPVFAKRSAETVVVVPDGKTVVIGGLMEDNKTENSQRFPFSAASLYWAGSSKGMRSRIRRPSSSFSSLPMSSEGATSWITCLAMNAANPRVG